MVVVVVVAKVGNGTAVHTHHHHHHHQALFPANWANLTPEQRDLPHLVRLEEPSLARLMSWLCRHGARMPSTLAALA